MAGINAFDRLNYGEFKLPTLQELMIAPSYMQEQYNKAQEEYLASQAMAADVATRFQPGIDDEAIKINKDFQDNIDADIENLSRNGLTPSIKRNLLQRKVDFTNNILPLNKAALDRENMAKAAYEAKLKNPSLITKDPMMVSLTNWIKDPESHELRPISGLEVAERTRAQMTAIRNYIDQNLPELHKTGIPYQYFTAARYGATESDIAQALAYNQGVDINKASNLARLIITAAQNVVNSTGVYDYYGADSPEADRVWDYAESEFNNALGTTKWGNMTDEYSMRYNLENLKAKSGTKKGSSEKISGLYFPDRLGTKLDVNQIAELEKLKEALDSSNTTTEYTWKSANGAGSYRVPTKESKESLQNKLKEFGIDTSQFSSTEDLKKAIDEKIDSFGKLYGYTTFDDSDLKSGFLDRVLPSLESGSIRAFSSAEDALNNQNPLDKSSWFSSDIKDLKKILTNKDPNSFSLESLDNLGLLRIRTKDGEESFYIKPEDIDQSEVGYYNALRQIRGMSEDDYTTLYSQNYNLLNQALEENNLEEATKLYQYLEFLSDLRDSTTPSRTKTAILASGKNQEIQFKVGE